MEKDNAEIPYKHAGTILMGIAGTVKDDPAGRPTKSIYLSRSCLQISGVKDICGQGFVVPYEQAWVGFIDDVPPANWGHSSRYVFIEANGMRINVERRGWPPDDDTFSLLEKII